MGQLNFFGIDSNGSIFSNINSLFKNFKILNDAINGGQFENLASGDTKLVSFEYMDCDLPSGTQITAPSGFTAYSENDGTYFGIGIRNEDWNTKTIIVQCYKESTNALIDAAVTIDSNDDKLVYIEFSTSPGKIRINIAYKI